MGWGGGSFRCGFCVSGSDAEHECEALHYCRGAGEGYLPDGTWAGVRVRACVLNFVARLARLNLCACLLLGGGRQAHWACVRPALPAYMCVCVCLWDVQRERTHSH